MQEQTILRVQNLRNILYNYDKLSSEEINMISNLKTIDETMTDKVKSTLFFIIYNIFKIDKPFNRSEFNKAVNKISLITHPDKFNKLALALDEDDKLSSFSQNEKDKITFLFNIITHCIKPIIDDWFDRNRDQMIFTPFESSFAKTPCEDLYATISSNDFLRDLSRELIKKEFNLKLSFSNIFNRRSNHGIHFENNVTIDIHKILIQHRNQLNRISSPNAFGDEVSIINKAIDLKDGRLMRHEAKIVLDIIDKLLKSPTSSSISTFLNKDIKSKFVEKFCDNNAINSQKTKKFIDRIINSISGRKIESKGLFCRR